MRPDYALFDVGAQGAVVSSAMLAKYGIDIPATERKKVRLLGVQGASTIQDKLTIVFEIFGDRVDAEGYESYRLMQSLSTTQILRCFWE